MVALVSGITVSTAPGAEDPGLNSTKTGWFEGGLEVLDDLGGDGGGVGKAGVIVVEESKPNATWPAMPTVSMHATPQNADVAPMRQAPRACRAGQEPRAVRTWVSERRR